MSAETLVVVAAVGLVALVLRVISGVALWFLRAESTGGWLLRGALAWVVMKVAGLI